MAIAPTGIADLKSSPLAIMEGFMQAREAELDGSEQKSDNIYEISAVPTDAQKLAIMSGYAGPAAHSSIASNQVLAQEEEKKKEDEIHIRRAVNNIIENQILRFNGMEFTYSDVKSGFLASIEQQERFLQRDIPRINKEDLLYVDEDGNVVSHNTYGARVVTTQEEKAALEERSQACKAGLTIEDVTLDDNGVMVPVEEINLNLAIQDRLDKTKEALEGIENGTVKLEDLPEELKKDIADIQEDGKLDIIAENTGPGILGALEQEGARNELIQEYKLRNDPPVSAPALTPGM